MDRTPTTSSPASAPAAHEGTMAGPPESPLQLSLPCARRAPPRVSDGGRAEPARPQPGGMSAAAARLGTTHRGAAGAQDGGKVERARRERARVLLLALLLRGRLHLHLHGAQQRAQRRPRCAHLRPLRVETQPGRDAAGVLRAPWFASPRRRTRRTLRCSLGYSSGSSETTPQPARLTAVPGCTSMVKFCRERDPTGSAGAQRQGGARGELPRPARLSRLG